MAGSAYLCAAVPGGFFKTIVVLDFEYETEGGDYGLRAGDPPRPLCMVAYILDSNLRLVRIVRLWRDQFGPWPPFDIGSETLIIAYAAWAELQCFLQLAWPFPANVLDLHLAYLAVTNVLLPRDIDKRKTKPPRKRLPDACRAYGLEGWEAIDKGTIAEDIGKGDWRKYGREAVIAYCEEDVAMTVRLLRAMLTGREPIDASRVIHWSEYGAKCVARIQHRGIPIDVALWNLVQENKAAVIAALVRKFDPSWKYPIAGKDGKPVRVYDLEGGWSDKRFETWLVLAGVPYWPRLDSGKLDLEGDTFALMAAIVPAVEDLHVLRDTIGFIAKARLPIGRDGRNRPSLFPFGTTTGRNAHRRSPYNAHAGVRGFIMSPEGSFVAYSDLRSQEVAVGAAVFRDSILGGDYLDGDIYWSLARMLGWTNDPDRKRWKREHSDQRDKAKIIQLGVAYGMTSGSLAIHLKRHPLIGEAVMAVYAKRYRRFWSGREAAYRRALEDRRILGADGWTLKLSHSPNERSLYNFPCQAGGAYQMREATIRMCEANIVPVMSAHDAFLLEETDPRRIEEAEQIMRDVASRTCGFPVDAARDQFLRPGEHYADKRPKAREVWATIMEVLAEIGALEKAA
jgi:hypothetical protein